MATVAEVAPEVGTAPVCRALGLARATVYRRRQPPTQGPPSPRPTPARALAPSERKTVIDELHGKRFCDRSPHEVHATLLEEGRYLCSPRTMYRILASNDEVRERRDQLRHPHYTKPELMATRAQPGLVLGRHQAQGPDQVGLLLPVRGPRHLQPLRRGLALGSAGKRRPRPAADPRDLRQAGHRTGPAHPPRRPRRTHDQQDSLAAAGRPGNREDPLPAPRLRRQSLLRVPVQDPQVLARFPGPLRLPPSTRGT